jgi:hypothetical protein
VHYESNDWIIVVKIWVSKVNITAVDNGVEITVWI